MIFPELLIMHCYVRVERNWLLVAPHHISVASEARLRSRAVGISFWGVGERKCNPNWIYRVQCCNWMLHISTLWMSNKS